MLTIKPIARKLSALFVTITLLGSTLGITTPALAQAAPTQAAANANLPIEQLLNPDGTLDLGTDYSGNLDIGNYGITLDPARGPLVRSLAAADTRPALGITSLNGGVSAIAISGTDVYVGGQFTNAGGNANADYIAKWDGVAWSALGTTPLNNYVSAIAISGTDVYVGGSFTDADVDANADYIAKWDGAVWSALGATPLNSYVSAIAISGTDVYAGGYFTYAGDDVNANYIAKWNGSAWSALGPGLDNGSVDTIAISGANVYAGGSFTDANGDANMDYIAVFNGSAWSALDIGLNSPVYALAVSGADLYAGGSFNDAGGDTKADHIAKFSAGAWSGLGTGLSNYVAAIAINGTDVYAGGDFTNAGGDIYAHYIAKWDGAAWSEPGTDLNDPVNAIAISGTDVYVGGLFTDAGADVNADHIVKFKTNITARTITSIGSQDGWILESSETSTAGGTVNTAATIFKVGDDWTKEQYLGILSFNTGSLPDTAVITGISLKVGFAGWCGGSNPLAAYQGFMVDIKKGLFGTSALQTADFQTPASKTYGPFSSGLMISGWYRINLTSGKAYINKLATNGGLTQIRLRFKLEDNNDRVANYLSLYSGNAPAADRPQLIIQYHLP